MPLLNYFSSKKKGTDHFQYTHAKFIPFFSLSIYGGYFGVGLGMMILTVFTFYGMKNVNEMKD